MPNSVSLAAAMASCSVLNLKIGAKGPKVSSRAHSMSGLASASRVGSKNWPEPRFGRRWPPVTIRPPLAMASATWRCTFSTAASSISGPWFTPASKPLPTLAVNPLAANFCTNSSYTASCTEKRFVHTQVWPALRYLLAKAPSTALSMSASANTMNGALPPSSSDIFLTVGALCAIRMRPTSVEPVKLMWRTTSLAHSTLPMAMELSLSAHRMLNTPAGMPARNASSAAASAVSGVNSAGLMITGQPAASAGATLRVIMASGKFQGVIAAQTPIDCRSTSRRRLLSNWGRVSPLMRLASSANHSTKLAPYPTSPLASASGLPCSAVMMRARSSWWASSNSHHLRKMMLRSLAVLDFQGPQAAFAAAMAPSASPGPRWATWASFRPVAGSSTSKRRLPATQRLSMSPSVLSRLGSLSVARGEVFMSMARLPGRYGTGCQCSTDQCPGVAVRPWPAQIAPSCPPPAQPFQHQQQTGGEQDQQGGHGGNGGGDGFADGGEHVGGQGGLPGSGQKERDHHFIERGGKRQQGARDHPGRNHRQRDAKKTAQRCRAQAQRGAH